MDNSQKNNIRIW